MKKLQVKHERFDPISKADNLVRQNGRGDPRFINACTAEDTILFKGIHVKAENLF